ncbi:GntR family transcriptional regulator [Bradyrhizobium sp. 2TAF24]|uniref:GntR family transcriptional regulator n=1 Tax=Bradyrhizobium sp. 2TAF24 TaxID=3233011 RepID=UPI003F91F235
MSEKIDPIATRIAAALTEQIITGELPPGAPLRQDHVAHAFGASHVPAREAFQLLRAAGLAVSEPRRGMRVAPLDGGAIREVVEMRAVLEMLAFRHAAPRFTAVHVAVIEEAAQAGEQAATIAAWEAANRDFHKALVEPCRMPRLLATLEQLRLANSRIVLAAARSASWRPRSNTDHRRIVEAIREKNPERAATLLKQHLHGMERTGTPAAPDS